MSGTRKSVPKTDALDNGGPCLLEAILLFSLADTDPLFLRKAALASSLGYLLAH